MFFFYFVTVCLIVEFKFLSSSNPIIFIRSLIVNSPVRCRMLVMVFVPAISTFYISKKLGSTGTTLVGDVIETQFKTAYNPNLGAAMSLVLMILIFICIGIMNKVSSDDDEGSVMV